MSIHLKHMSYYVGKQYLSPLERYIIFLYPTHIVKSPQYQSDFHRKYSRLLLNAMITAKHTKKAWKFETILIYKR